MDINQFLKTNGVVTVGNPSYNKNSKNNTEPPTIDIVDLGANRNQIVDIVAKDLENQWSVPYKDIKKYIDKGITWNPIDAATGSLDRQLADSQHWSEKFFNAIAQSLNELTLGTINGFMYIIDGIGQAIGLSDHNYSNPIIDTIDRWQQKFNDEVVPIYQRPDSGFGGDISIGSGWWAANLPSVVTSLSMFIPARTLTSGAKAIGKGVAKSAKAAKTAERIAANDRVINAVNQGSRTSKKWSNRIAARQAENSTAKNVGLFKSSAFRAKTSALAEAGVMGALSRTIENYQEARQVYNDMYVEASDALFNMSDEEYNDFLERNKNTLEGIDTNDKDAVAKAISRKSADTTFREDYVNTVFDIAQIYLLRNVHVKGLRNKDTTPKIRRAHLNAIRYAGKSPEEITKAMAERSIWAKGAEKIGDWMVGGVKTTLAELSEGVEEAVNYIAQQEGMNVGHVMLGSTKPTYFNERLMDYVHCAELYESAFWGVAGGVVFQGLGNQFEKATNAVKYKKDKKRYKQLGFNVDGKWTENYELADNKIRISAIDTRTSLLSDTVNKFKTIIVDKKNPYEKDGNGQFLDIGENEQDILLEKVYEDFITSVALNGMFIGNYNLDKEFMQSDEVKKVFVEQGHLTQEQADEIQRDVNEKFKHIEEIYDKEVKNLDSLSVAINRKNKRAEPIPIEYIQKMAKMNVVYKLRAENLEKQIAAWKRDNADIVDTLGNKLDEFVPYEDMTRLYYYTRCLSELEAEKRAIIEEGDSGSITGQEILMQINNRMDVIKNMIEDINRSMAPDYLLWAVHQSKQAKMTDEGVKLFADDAEFGRISMAMNNLELDEIRKLDENIAKLTDDALTDVIKGMETTTKNMYDAFVGRNLDATQNVKALGNISEPLMLGYMKVASLETELALARNATIVTEPEMVREVNMLFNELDSARRNAFEMAKNVITGITDKYGSEKVLDVVRRAYRGETFDSNDVLGETEEAKDDLKTLLDALDMITINPDVNGINFSYIENIIIDWKNIKEAQKENNITSQNEDTSEDNSNSNNTSSGTQNNVRGATNGSNGNTQSQNASNTNQRSVDKSKATDEAIKDTIKYNDTTRGRAFNVRKINGVYRVDFKKGADGVAAYFGNKDWFVLGDGVDLLNDNYQVTLNPAVELDENGNLVVTEKGKIELIGTSNNNTNNATTENTVDDSNNNNVIPPDNTVTQPSNTVGNVDGALTNADVINPSTGVVRGGRRIDDTVDTTNVYSNLTELHKAIGDAIINMARNIAAKSMSYDESIFIKLINETFGDAISQLSDNDKITTNTVIKSYLKIVSLRLRKNGIEPDTSGNTTSNATDELLYQSLLVETSKPNDKAINDYRQALQNVIDEYLTQLAIHEGITRVINDNGKAKYIINIHSLLRYCNSQVGDDYAAKALYNSVVAYMTNAAGKELYVVTDEDLNKVQELINYTEEDAREYVKSEEENDLFGINFKGTPHKEEEQKLVDKWYSRADIGDDIKFKAENGHIKYYVTIDNKEVVIGILPKPLVLANGTRVQVNQGWVTDVYQSNGKLYSKLRELFISWVNNPNQNDDIYSLNDIIFRAIATKKYNFSKELIYEFINNPEIQKAYSEGFINKSNVLSEEEDFVEALKGLAELWRYVDNTNIADFGREISIDMWFEKVYDSFNMIDAMFAEGIGTCKVGFINDGKWVVTSRENALPSSKAIGDVHKGKVRFGVYYKTGECIVAGTLPNGETRFTRMNGGGFTTNSTVAIIPSRTGHHQEVHAYPIKFNDDRLGKKLRGIPNAVKTEIEKLLKGNESTNTKPATTPSEKLQAFRKILQPLLANGSGRNALFLGCYYSDFYDGIKLCFGDKVGKDERGKPIYSEEIIINSKSKNKYDQFYVVYRYTTEDGSINETITDVNKVTEIIQSNINTYCSFNMNANFVNSDNTGNANTKAITRDNGKYVIHVGSQSFEFDNFNDFALNNDAVLLTTNPGTLGDNKDYSIKDDKYASTYAPNVRIEYKSTKTTPVEGEMHEESKPVARVESVKSIVEQVNDAIQDRKNTTTIGKRIAQIILGEKVNNNVSGIITSIFPSNVRFVDGDIGANAVANISEEDDTYKIDDNISYVIKARQILIGREWKTLLQTDPKQAVRKLIHEQLHLTIHKPNTNNKDVIEKIRGIFDIFAKVINSNQIITDASGNVIDKEALKKYLYEYDKDSYYTDGKLNSQGLEEFLVETFTSKELIEALNNITYEGDKTITKSKKESLFQRIMKYLAELFGWDIKKDSLYEEEFNRLSDAFIALEKNEKNENKEQNEENEEQNDNRDLQLDSFYSDLFSRITEEIDNKYSHSIGNLNSFVERFEGEDKQVIKSFIDSGNVEVICK